MLHDKKDLTKTVALCKGSKFYKILRKKDQYSAYSEPDENTHFSILLN